VEWCWPLRRHKRLRPRPRRFRSSLALRRPLSWWPKAAGGVGTATTGGTGGATGIVADASRTGDLEAGRGPAVLSCLSRVFWAALDRAATAMTQAQLSLLDLIHGPEAPTPADEEREADKVDIVVSRMTC
jgi:hypothetical protein